MSEVLLMERFGYLGCGLLNADSFLDNSRSFPLQRQLDSRRIIHVDLAQDDEKLGLYVRGADGFGIRLTRGQLLYQQAFEFARAVGDTFHFNLTMSPPQDLLGGETSDDIRRFSEAFAERWLARVGYQRVERFVASATGQEPQPIVSVLPKAVEPIKQWELPLEAAAL